MPVAQTEEGLEQRVYNSYEGEVHPRPVRSYDNPNLTTKQADAQQAFRFACRERPKRRA